MIRFVADAFASDLTQRALVAGLLAAITTSLVGTWVVVRGLAFFSDALAHGVLPGIAVAALAGWNLSLGAMASAGVMVAGINVVHRTRRLGEDTGIGLLFVGMLALGVVLISREPTYSGDLTALLFGDVLGVGTSALVLEAVALGVVLIGLAVGHRAFLALALGADKAETLGLRPRWAHAGLLGLVAVAVVADFRAVGTLLVFGLLVAPPATALLLVRRLVPAMALAALCGSSAVVAGLVVSYHADTAASATIAGIAVGQCFLALAATSTTRLSGRSRSAR